MCRRRVGELFHFSGRTVFDLAEYLDEILEVLAGGAAVFIKTTAR